MEVGIMLSNLISNILSIMQHFTFSVNGYSVNLLQIFGYFLAVGVVLKLYNTFISHK